MNIETIRRLSSLALVVLLFPFRAAADENRWWPVQAVPKAVVRLENPGGCSSAHAACEMMAQSVAGLAAKAVNEGRGDEMVWIVTGNADVEDWFARRLQRQPELEQRGTFGLWDLVDRYAGKGVIKGYILYRWDGSKGDDNERRPGMDCSVNVATSLAGFLDGIIVDESLEAEAKAHGLTNLVDVRDKTQAWCFETYKDRFSRRMVCTQNPRKSNVRDLAIAQKVLTVYGDDEPVPAVMKWLEPLSPVLGWNNGDEFKTTRLSTIWGHLQTSTDWCMNLPVLMAGTEKTDPPRVRDFNPQTIDWRDARSAVSFITSDGDNVDFSLGDFFREGNARYYWASPDRGRIAFGWSSCFAHVSQLFPEAMSYAAATQSTNDWFVEWGGGYYYPDLFGRARTNRWELLAQHARRTWALMRKTNTRVIGFDVAKVDSPDALKAYETIAAQTDGLLAILVFQYDAYEAGAGRTFWVKDRKGCEVPVISARYLIWNHLNKRPRAGTPAKVAREIRQTVEQTPRSELPRYDWVNIHAWSWFKHASGIDEDAEDMPQEPSATAAARGGVRGYAPVLWCASRLPGIRVVGPEELVWRIRMKHNPEQTRKLIHDWPRESRQAP
ncbi:MAG: hypothetical protein IT581_18960 [Verrucomicrobiales bacterium]|nr:hypothetical protein [Verrucomicrobiales bacterium]